MDIWSNKFASSRRPVKMVLAGVGLAFATLAIFCLSQSVLAQGSSLGLNEFAANTNLGTRVDLISLIARIINITLGFLGVIAIGLIIYAGWLWLTSRGDAEKIAKAKKIMAGAAIGLAIILSAFAIASFIIRQIQNSTGGGGGTGLCWDGNPPPCPPPPFGGSYMSVRSQGPMGNGIKLCEAVQATFSEAVQWSTVTAANFRIIEAASGTPFASGTYQPGIDSSNISFTHLGNDFAANTTYQVTLRSGAAGLRGVSNLSLRTDKVWTFTTGTESDQDPPEVISTQPPSNATDVCRATPLQVIFSEPMLATSFIGNVLLRERASGAVVSLSEPTFGDGYRIATLRPSTTLAALTEYEVVLTGGPGGITDTCGNPLAGNYTWTFTTGETTDCSPRISSVTPDRRDYAQVSTIIGTNLFLDGEVYVNGFPADSNSFPGAVPPENILCYARNSRDGGTTCDSDEIKVRAPVGASTGPAYDQAGFTQTTGVLNINVGGASSNELPFTITSPYIDHLSPNSGGPGQYVTVTGWNFGDTPGQVKFVRADGTFVLGEPPVGCNNWWSETEIVVKVPEGLVANVSYQVEVTTATGGTNGGSKRSNRESFRVTSAQPGPGICTINPTAWPMIGLPTNLTITGERFGDSRGSSVVTFANSENSDEYVSWSDTEIVAETPAGGVNRLRAATWPVQVKVGGVLSNSKNFVVTPDTTVYPTVVESASCSSDTQSPSPYKDTTNGCGNAALSARFTVPMNRATLTIGASGNINVMECGNGPTIGPCTTSVSFRLPTYLYDSQNQVIGFSALPTASFQSGYWYQATITTNVRSLDNRPLQAPYVWKFKVASNVCPLNSVVETPSYSVIHELRPDPGSLQTFSASATASNCNIINPGDYTWRWTTANHTSDSGPRRIQIQNDGFVMENAVAEITIEAIDWTPTGKPSRVTVEAVGENKSDTSDVYVSDIFCVESSNCNACGTGLSSCLNGACTPVIGNRLSGNPDGLSPDDGAVGTWVTISGCYFGNSRGLVEYGNVAGAWPDPAICGPSTWSNQQIISEVPVGAGTDVIKIKRTDNAQAISPTAFVVNDLNRPGICRRTPAAHYERDLGTSAATLIIDGHAFGASRLTQNFWQKIGEIIKRVMAAAGFSTSSDNVNYYYLDTLTNSQVYSGSAVSYPSWSDKQVKAITPAPPATVIGPNWVSINKRTVESNRVSYSLLEGGGGLVGESCDADPDTEMCEDNGICSAGLFCDTSRGCTCQLNGGTGQLPRVVSVVPARDATNICRNTVVIMNFDIPVTSNTIRGGEFILKQLGGSCAGENSSRGLIRWLGRLFNAIRGAQAGTTICNVSGSLRTAGNSIIFTPSVTLSPNANYLAEITSPNVDCANSGGLCRWNFFTGPDICQINSVSITPPSRLFTATGQTQNFIARALAADGQPLAADYAWTKQDPSNVITIAPPLDVETVSISATTNNGEATAIATADGTRWGNSGVASGRAAITVFLCAEPWLVEDTNYDFNLMYCRGQTEDINLLPELMVTSIDRNPVTFNGLMREYFFKHPENNEVIGLRIYQNPTHLSPAEWYAERGDIKLGNPSTRTVDGYQAVADSQTTYVGAVAKLGSNLYTNIYVLSFSQGATAETTGIYRQMVNEWIFNPALDADEQAKLQRDLDRLQDLASISSKLATYAASHNNSYPTLPAGTFLVGKSTSAWSSWQAELGNALGSALPVDPLNTFKNCPTGYDPKTCWQASTKSFICPAGSHVYQYTVASDATSYTLNANLEFKNVTWHGSPTTNVGSNDECDSYSLSSEAIDSQTNLSPPTSVSVIITGSPTRNLVTISWTAATATGGGVLSHYQLRRAPDNKGAPGAWSNVGGPIYVRTTTDNPPSDGIYWYGVLAFDSNGNYSTEQAAVPAIKDSQAPLDPICDLSGGTFTTAQQVSCSASDQGAFKTTTKVHFTTGSAMPSCGSPVFNSPTAINSNTKLNLIACDAAANISSVVSHTYTINSVTPTAMVTFVAQDAFNNPLAGASVRLDGAVIGQTPTISTITLGNHTVTFDNSLACFTLESVTPTQPMNVTGDITVSGVFAAAAPSAVTSPRPSNQAAAVNINPTLSWSVAPCSASYDIYFGTNQTAVANATTASPEFKGNLATPQYSPSGLSYTTTYYWRVDARNSSSVTKGAVWSFTTETAPVAKVTINAQDSDGFSLSGAFARLDGELVGLTPTTISTTYGSHTASFDNTLACYTYASLTPAQPMDVTGNVTVVGTFNQTLPLVAINPSPNQSTTNVPAGETSLSWTSGGCSASFDIYFGTNQTAVANATTASPEFKGNTASVNWTISGVASSTTYYWRVDARNGAGVSKGTIWNFTTAVSAYNVTFEARDETNTLVTGASFTVDGGAKELTSKSLSLPQGSHTVAYLNNLACHNFSGTVTPSATFNVTSPMTVTGLYKRSLPSASPAPQDPVNGGSKVKLDTTLVWEPAACYLSYDVYLGTSLTAVQNATTASPEYKGNVAVNSYKPSTLLSYGTTYYWRIDARNAVGTVASAVWQFTTENAPTAQVTFQTRDSLGVTITGVTARLDGSAVGTTPTSLTTLLGLHTANFDNTLACYTFSSLTPAQPMNVTANVTVTGTFTADLPALVIGPSPTVNATGVSINPSLTWSTSTCATSYDIYFGTSQVAVQKATITSSEYKINTTSTNYLPGTLNYATTYYWRIDARNAAGTTKGTVWNFTTQDPPTATITLHAKDGLGNNLAGATARLDGIMVGTTPTAVNNVLFGNHTASFDDTLPCYKYGGLTPAQPMNVTGNITVTGTFALQLPGAVTNPDPANGTETSLMPTLSWTAGSCSTSFDVYLGTDLVAVTNANITSAEFIKNTTNNSFTTDLLSPWQTYYWRVDARNSIGLTKGSVWYFKTRSPIISVDALDDLGNRIHGVPVYLDGLWVGITYGYMPYTASVPAGLHAITFNSFYDCYNYMSIAPTQPMNVIGSTYVAATFWPLTKTQTAYPYFPADGATNILPKQIADGGIIFTLTCGASFFDIYFGDSSAAVQNATKTSPEYQGTYTKTQLPSLTFFVDSLSNGKTYYWRIDTGNIMGTNKGSVWSFTTTP